MGAPLTEDEVDAIVHSVARRVVKHRQFRELAIRKFAEHLANGSPQSNLSISHDAKGLATIAETWFVDRADTYHWPLKKEHRAHKSTAAEDFARAEAAGLAPFQNGAR